MKTMFVDFSKKISGELKLKLPGFSAQSRMSPPGRKAMIDSMNEKINPQLSAVLILLFSDDQSKSPKIVLIERSENENGNHSGQIAFPGGRVEDSDSSLLKAALREAEEEIGINQSDVTILGALTPLFIPVSNFLVHPFVGVNFGCPEFIKHSKEVNDIVSVGLDDLFSKEIKSTAEILIKNRSQKMEVPCYKIEGKVIWGATAMIISEFEEIIRRIK